MIKFQKIREKTETCRWDITPTYSEILEEAKKWEKYCDAYMAGPGIWQVTSSSEKTYCVNLNNYTCDCRRWDMTAVPCSHAIAAMQKVKLHPEDFVHEFFKKPLYCETYKHIIYPVPGPDCWPHTMGDDISPPVFKKKKGKKQTARRKGHFEVPAKKDTSRIGTVTCSNCNMQGHRYTTCGVPLKPKLHMRKNNHQVYLLIKKLPFHRLGGLIIICFIKCAGE